MANDHLKPVPKVSVLTPITTLDIPTERVLNAALSKKVPLQGVLVIGVDADGEFYFASSIADGADTLWWLKIAEKRLLEIGDVQKEL